MAFPTVVASATSSALSGNLTLTMPSGIGRGHLLIAVVAGDSDSAATMTAWDKIGYGANGSKGDTVWRKMAVGEGSDAGVHTGGSKARMGHVYCIDGWSGVLTEVQAAFGSTNTLNPPNLDMTTARDYLWLAAARSDPNITAAPTNFTDLLVNNVLGTAYLATARRAVNASSLDPGAFTGTSTSAHSLTIGVTPSPVPRGAFLPFF